MNDTVALRHGGCGRVGELSTAGRMIAAGVLVCRRTRICGLGGTDKLVCRWAGERSRTNKFVRATRRFRRVGALVALLAVSAYASDEEAGKAGRPHAGVNQSVTLERTEPAPDPVGIPTASTHGPSEGQEKVERPLEANGPTKQRRMLRRRPSPQERLVEPKAVSTPWYRSGFGALAIVLAIVGGLYCIVRRWAPSLRAADNEAVRVVGRTSLTPKHHVALIKVGRRFLAVGMSGDRMTTLCEVSDPVEAAELAASVGVKAAGGSNGFDDLLLRETAEYHELSNEVDETPVPVSGGASTTRRPVRDLLQRLQTLRSK